MCLIITYTGILSKQIVHYCQCNWIVVVYTLLQNNLCYYHKADHHILTKALRTARSP